ncbi:MAG TPA: sulfatase-like hydrolase/transferase [bacterium]
MGFLRKLWNLPALPASLLLTGTGCVFVPALIYQGNRPFFTVGLTDAFVYLVPAWLALSLALALPSMGVETRAKRLYTRGLTAVAGTLWANATFSIGTTGLLDGANFELVRGFTSLYQNTLWVLGVGAILFFVAGRWATVLRTFALLLVGLLTVNTLYITATSRPKTQAVADPSLFKSFSSASNFLFIVLDTFQSDLFAEMVEQEPALAKPFEGFTYFKDAAAVSPTTYVAMPTIHSGTVWDTTSPLPTVYQRNVTQGSLLTKLAEAGYDTLLLNAVFHACPEQVACNSLPDVTVGHSSSASATAAELLDIALLRAAPHLVKPAVFRDGEWLFSGISLLRASDTHLSNLALDALAEELQVDAKRPTAKFLHLFNTHPPAQFTANCRYTGRTQWTRASVEGLDRCALTHLTALLEKMKQAGIYTNSVIVVTADHGSYLPREGAAAMAVRANPVLLIKPAGATGPLRTSTVQASLVDIPATACALTKACAWPVGSNVFTLKPGDRERVFVNYVWKSDGWSMTVLPILGRYHIRGPLLDTNSWDAYPVAPAARVHRLEFNGTDPTQVFGPGWTEPGALGMRWAGGSSAVLYLDAAPNGSGKVTATVSTLPENTAQRMEVWVAGQRVYQGAVATGAPQDVTFQVPKALLGSGKLTLRFRFAQWQEVRNRNATHFSAVAFHRLQVE